jgi:hypothetical protein
MNFDDDNDADFPESFTSISFKFKTIRIVDNVITSFVNTLRSEVYIDQDASSLDITMSLEKIHFWFDYIVSNSIMFCRENEFALNIMFDAEGNSKSGNIPMVLPDDPDDDIVTAMLHCKLNALGKGIVNFGTMELTSDTRENLMITFTGYGEMLLPVMEEWIGKRSYHEQPWWARSDGSTLDVIPAEDADLTKPPVIGIDLGFIEERYKSPAATAPIVLRPSFKPEVINGGKDDTPKS